MATHAVLSPSGAHRWMRCVGAPSMEFGLTSSSVYADEGTAAHFVGATCLRLGTNASVLADTLVAIDKEGDCRIIAERYLLISGEKAVNVDSDMVRYVQQYLDFVRELSVNATLLVEVDLPIGHITGEEGATGSGDAVILADNVLRIVDLKYGRGAVVSAISNEQMRLYALGAIQDYGGVYEFDEVAMYIFQPRAAPEPSVEIISVKELLAWSLHCAQQAAEAMSVMDYSIRLGSGSFVEFLTAGEKQCQWCKAKANCPKLSEYVEATVGAQFDEITATPAKEVKQAVKDKSEQIPDEILGQKLDAIELIEQWCKAVRAEVERKLLSGEPVAGYKLVQGKRGNRSWASESQVEELFKSMRLKAEEKYTMKLISPTQAEALLKDTPKRWERVLGSKLITQTPGGPSVAPISDKREVYNPSAKAEDFDFDVEGLI